MNGTNRIDKKEQVIKYVWYFHSLDTNVINRQNIQHSKKTYSFQICHQ